MDDDVVLLHETAHTLERAISGDRAWYWYLDRGLHGRPNLLYTSREAAPEPVDFLRRVAEVASEIGTPGRGARSFGTAEVGPTGAIRLLSEQPGGRFPDRLASVVVDAAPRCLPLRRLVGFTHGQLADGSDPVEASPDVDWDRALPERVSLEAGLLAWAAAAAIRRCGLGDRLLFAFVANGPGGDAALVLQPDTRAGTAAFRDACVRLGAALPEAPRWLSGIVTFETWGTRFTGPPETPNFLRRLADWLAHHVPHAPELRRLAPAVLEKTGRDGRIASRAGSDELWTDLPDVPLHADYAPLRQSAARIAAAEPGHTLRFLFTPRAFHGAPALLIDDASDKAAVRAHAEEALGGRKPLAAPVRGLARVAGDGRMDLRVPESGRDLLADLAPFVLHAERIAPELARLRNARLHVTHAGSKRVELIEHPELWGAA